MTIQLELAALERDWVDSAYDLVWGLRQGSEFATDDLHDSLPRPQHPNWWGVLLAKCRTVGIVEPIGYRPSLRPEANGRVIRVWRRR